MIWLGIAAVLAWWILRPIVFARTYEEKVMARARARGIVETGLATALVGAAMTAAIVGATWLVVLALQVIR